ncbi:hypothetical protein DYD21_16425 [Rhodohalobacter sp. SW132]|uniref:hypothetical protein n=1 Tax=Rhodohalobacter sp. SW132 TaxID=2293433 RepID=UPI000E373193|nr:hypothetical protein [Rhodohalobacter sp. SW132]REL24752.1 hypothetical protein DYD21_16425 [Rhodohalobacter sp. SW132]
MTGFNRYKIHYYGTVSVVSLVLITLLISLLNWPLPAGLALGSALFLHSLILSRSLKDLFLGALEKGMIDDLLYSLKADTEISERNSNS